MQQIRAYLANQLPGPHYCKKILERAPGFANQLFLLIYPRTFHSARANIVARGGLGWTFESVLDSTTMS